MGLYQVEDMKEEVRYNNILPKRSNLIVTLLLEENSIRLTINLLFKIVPPGWASLYVT